MTLAELREAIDRLPDDVEIVVRADGARLRDLALASAMLDKDGVNRYVLLLVTEDADEGDNERSDRG